MEKVSPSLGGFVPKASALLKQVATEQNSPAQLGAAVAMGIIIGTTPFYGFHLGICIVIATLLRLNRALTYLAANISLPWVIPFLLFGSLQLGNQWVHGEWLPITVETIQNLDPWDFGQTLILGSLSLGTLIGIPAGLVTYGFALRYQTAQRHSEDPISIAMQKTVDALKPYGPFAFRYAAGKFKHDPIYRQLANRCPLLEPILDIGCGRGQTQLLLANLHPSISMVGLDWDEDKIALATQAAKPFENVRFQRADSRSTSLPKSGTILMLDILHYSSLEEQDRLLREVANALEPRGLVLIREMDADRGWRSTLTQWQEKLGIWMGINKGATLCFRPAQEICDVLEQAGLNTTLVPSWADTPLSNVLIEATKAPNAPS